MHKDKEIPLKKLDDPSFPIHGFGLPKNSKQNGDAEMATLSMWLKSAKVDEIEQYVREQQRTHKLSNFYVNADKKKGGE